MPTFIEIGSGIRHSKVGDSYEAGLQAAQEALEPITVFDPSVCFVFCSPSLRPFSDTLNGIRDAIASRMNRRFGPNSRPVPMLGCTTAAGIHGTTILEDGVIVAIWASPHVRVRCSVARDVFFSAADGWTLSEESLEGAVRELGLISPQANVPGARCLIIVCPGFLPLKDTIARKILKDHEILEWFRSAAIRRCFPLALPMWGGSPGDREPPAYQFADYQPLTNSTVLATLDTELRIGVGVGFDFSSLDSFYPITKLSETAAALQGYAVDEIDGRPVRTFFPKSSNGLSIEGSPRRNVLYSTIDPLTGAISAIYPYAAVKGGTGLVFSRKLSREFSLRPLFVDSKKIVNGARDALDRAMRPNNISPERVSAILSVSCQGRLAQMKEFRRNDNGPGPQAEIEVLTDACPTAVPVGWYAYGEIGTSREGLGLPANWSHSILAVSDELDPVRTSSLAASAAERAASCVKILTGEVSRIGSTHGLFHIEEKKLWAKAVEIVNDLIGGQACTLFLRDEMDHFHLSGSTSDVTDPTTTEPTKPWLVYYELGQGLTGWVAKTGLTLNLTQRGNAYLHKLYEMQLRDQIAGNGDDDPPTWRNHFTENPIDASKSKDENAPFLAAPLLVGTDVVGVVRAAGVRDPAKLFFSYQDEQVMRACAQVLGLTHATLERAREFRWKEIGSLTWAAQHEIGAPVTSLDITRLRFEEFVNRHNPSLNSGLAKDLQAFANEFRAKSARISSSFTGWKEVNKLNPGSFAKVDLRDIVRTTIQTFERKRLLKIRNETTEAVIRGSNVALGILLRELLTNAAKELGQKTDSDSITVRTERQNDHHLVLTVGDKGPGIFHNNRSSQGTGLAICEYIARQHGAGFYVESPIPSLGHGTAVHIVFHVVEGTKNVG